MIKRVLQNVPVLQRKRPDLLAGNFTLCREYWDNRKKKFIMTKSVSSPLENMDEKTQRKKQRIDQELEFFRAWNNNLPETLKKYHWNILLYNCDLESKRIDYYKQLAMNEMKMMKKNDKKKTVASPKTVDVCQQNSFVFLDGSENFSADVPCENGSLWRDRVQEVHKHRGVHSLSHGVPVIFDVDYDMDHVWEKQVCNHIRYCNKINLHHWDPMHILLTGCKNKRIIIDHLTQFSDDFFVDVYDENFTDLFDKRQLVYLLPYGPPMPFFKESAIYVIQPINYFTGMPQSALWKAKEHRIQYCSLPFNRFPG